MVSRLAQGAGALALAPLLAGAVERKFKIGICEWSLGKSDPSSFDLAKQIGLEGVQITLGTVANGLNLRQPAVQRAYREAARRTGVEIASLCLSETSVVPLFSEPKAAVWLLDSLDVCRAMHQRVLLVAQFGEGELRASDSTAMGRMADLLREVAPRAEKAGVVLGLENYLSAEENLRLIDQVGSPAVQVYYDVGNSAHKGYDVPKEIRLLGKHICEFHLKDFYQNEYDGSLILSKARLDYQAIRAAIADIGYRGWLLIEIDTTPDEAPAVQKENLAYLKTLFPA
jgi:sugar phosphate isomerase/epimerase